MSKETLSFQAEVSKILDIVVNSLYSQREIFLRELISNASDACDKLRYEAISDPDLISGESEFRIGITLNQDARTITIEDNGIGMSRDDLIANLGTIARSGTSEFLKCLGDDSRKDMSLIGQFGVGFYSAFMVADTVSVQTRKAGENQGWRWESDGRGSFVIDQAADSPRGTIITLHLKEDASDFLSAYRIEQIVKTYSDHIGLPVVLKGGNDGKSEDRILNTASALWTRAKSDVTAEQYKEFYHHSAHAFDDPWLTLHFKAEGALEYSGLLFIPSTQPFDLFRPERKQHVKLYVNRIFITDDCEGLLPPYLRFVRGVVDSSDLPLNVSREMLQHNPVLAKVRSGLTKRILSELKKKSADQDAYAGFWKEFGAVLKEGLYEDFERRNDLLELARFRSTAVPGLTSLAEAKTRMKEGQDALYYITGGSEASLRKSPHLEGFIAKGVEVLLLVDPIDEFWPMSVSTYQDTALKSVAQGSADLSAIKGDSPSDETTSQQEKLSDEALKSLTSALKASLGAAVKEVRPTDRLTSSPCCLIADEGQMSPQLQRLLKTHSGEDAGKESPRILEINPHHALIRRLADKSQTMGSLAEIEDAVFLLFDQALIAEGELPPDPAAFTARLTRLMEKGIV